MSQSVRLSQSLQSSFEPKQFIPSNIRPIHFVHFSVDKHGGVGGICHRHLNYYPLLNSKKLDDDDFGYSHLDDDEYYGGGDMIPKTQPEPVKTAFENLVEAVSNWVKSIFNPESVKISATPSAEVSEKGVNAKLGLSVEFKPGKLPKEPKTSYQISQYLQQYLSTTTLKQHQEVLRILWASSEGMRREIEGQTSLKSNHLTAFDLMGHTSSLRISTGNRAIDEVLGGGIPTMRITEVFGVYGWGKKELAHTLCITTYLSTGGRVIYVDSSDSFDPELIKQISKRFEMDWEIVLKNIMYVPILSVNDQWKFLKNLADGSFVETWKLLVLDPIFEDKGEEELSKEMFCLRKIALDLKVAVFIMSTMTKPTSSMRHGYKAYNMPCTDVVFEIKPGGSIADSDIDSRE